MNHPFQPAGLVAAALWAVAGALASRAAGPPAAAAALIIAVALSLSARRAGPWLLVAPAALAALAPPAPALPWPRPGPVLLRGVVMRGVDVDPRAGETRFRMAALGGSSAAAECIVHGALDVLPGDVVRGTARFGAQERRRREGRLPVLEAEAETLSIAAGAPSLARAAEGCRLALQDTLLAAVPGAEGALLCRLVLGRGPPLQDDLAAAHRATGLAHLLAVSGAHASMLGLLCGVAFGWLTGRSPLRSSGYRRFCAAFLLLYGAITGLEPPVLRAVAAFVLVLWARARGRRVTVAAALALPALLTAVLAPDDLCGASFCLSYAAVIGLALGGAFAGRTWLERWVRTPIVASFWAALATAPLTLWYFGQLAPWTIVATPLLAPLVALLLAGGIVVAVVGLASSPVAAALALPLRGGAAAYCAAVRGAAELPCTPVFAVSAPAPGVLLGCGLLGVALLCARPGRASAAALCALLSLPHFLPAPAAPPGLTLLAVGHGQACVVHLDHGVSALVDCGALGDPLGPARAASTALLPSRRLDVLIVTHGDFDHAGAVPALVQRMPIARAVLPAELARGPLGALLAAHGAEVIALRAGERQEVAAGLAVVRPRVDGGGTNDHGLWVRASCRAFSAWLCGDAEEAGVNAWLTQTRDVRADVLVLPHHGRPQTRTAALLRAVQPRVALVSNAEGDGRSAQGEVARGLGVEVWETGSAGTVLVEDAEGIDSPAPGRLARTPRTEAGHGIRVRAPAMGAR